MQFKIIFLILLISASPCRPKEHVVDVKDFFKKLEPPKYQQTVLNREALEKLLYGQKAIRINRQI